MVGGRNEGMLDIWFGRRSLRQYLIEDGHTRLRLELTGDDRWQPRQDTQTVKQCHKGSRRLGVTIKYDPIGWRNPDLPVRRQRPAWLAVEYISQKSIMLLAFNGELKFTGSLIPKKRASPSAMSE